MKIELTLKEKLKISGLDMILGRDYGLRSYDYFFNKLKEDLEKQYSTNLEKEIKLKTHYEQCFISFARDNAIFFEEIINLKGELMDLLGFHDASKQAQLNIVNDIDSVILACADFIMRNDMTLKEMVKETIG
jgi:hypothetical protein